MGRDMKSIITHNKSYPYECGLYHCIIWSMGRNAITQYLPSLTSVGCELGSWPINWYRSHGACSTWRKCESNTRPVRTARLTVELYGHGYQLWNIAWKGIMVLLLILPTRVNLLVYQRLFNLWHIGQLNELQQYNLTVTWYMDVLRRLSH